MSKHSVNENIYRSMSHFKVEKDNLHVQLPFQRWKCEILNILLKISSNFVINVMEIYKIPKENTFNTIVPSLGQKQGTVYI
jgi:hypothetical protein